MTRKSAGDNETDNWRQIILEHSKDVSDHKLSISCIKATTY
jgi:hypothetical protein